MELFKEDGKYYIKTDVTEVFEHVKRLCIKGEAPANPDLDQSLYPKNTAEEEREADEAAKEAAEQKLWMAECALPGEEQTPPYHTVPRYQIYPDFDSPAGYYWKDHIWGWYARKLNT